MIDRQKFFDSIKTSLFDKLSQSQVDGINAILDEYERWGVMSKVTFTFTASWSDIVDLYRKNYDSHFMPSKPNELSPSEKATLINGICLHLGLNNKNTTPHHKLEVIE